MALDDPTAVGVACGVVAAVMFAQAMAAEVRQHDIEFEDFHSSVKRDTAVYSRRHDRYLAVAIAFIVLCAASMISCAIVYSVTKCKYLIEHGPEIYAAHMQAQAYSAAPGVWAQRCRVRRQSRRSLMYGAIPAPCGSGNVPGASPPPYPNKAEPQPACYARSMKKAPPSSTSSPSTYDRLRWSLALVLRIRKTTPSGPTNVRATCSLSVAETSSMRHGSFDNNVPLTFFILGLPIYQ
eukprot:m51a1_g9920 hypothetical protein (237) ;mRNA; f:149251-152992